MAKNHLISRLDAILKQLIAAYQGSSPMGSTIKGYEREYFIDIFLRNCLPSHLRLGSGEVTDRDEKKTGQLDIIIEQPFSPSLPLLGSSRQRLYFAEGVGAVIEVKSDLQKQWDEVVRTAQKVESQTIMGGSSSGIVERRFPKGKIPFIAVGYRGWKKSKVIENKRRDHQRTIDGILQLEPARFVVCSCDKDSREDDVFEGASALGALLIILSHLLTAKATSQHDLFRYLKD